MNLLTPAERGDLADRMLPVAARVAAIVHGDGDARDIAHALDPLDRIELVAVIVALGAFADPDQRLSKALAFITWDEHGHRAEPLDCGRYTVRSLIPSTAVTPNGYTLRTA